MCAAIHACNRPELHTNTMAVRGREGEEGGREGGGECVHVSVSLCPCIRACPVWAE